MKFFQTIAALDLPWMLDLANPGHVVFCSRGKGNAKDALGGLVGQILQQTSPGAVRFLFLDSAAMGRSFGAFAALGDASREAVYGGIVTNSQEIRRHLLQVRDEIAGLNKDKLRTQFSSLDAYNASVRQSSGAAGEPYRYVVIADWPHGFDGESCAILKDIIEEGARCGVHVLASWDVSEEPPHLYKTDALKIWRGAYQINMTGSTATSPMLDKNLVASQESMKLGDSVARHKAGLSNAASAVYNYEAMIKGVAGSSEKPYVDLGKPWSKGASAGGLVIPVGIAGGARLASVEIGQGSGDSRHHALLVGVSGSGKSNLIQVMVLSLAELYSPEEVWLYLVDLKGSETFGKFVEHRLPHARVVAVESDPAFGISVLEEVKAELERRRKRFSDIEKHRSSTGETVPRVVLFIDEFQKLFEGDSKSIDSVNSLISVLAREGRSFGINLVFSTQTMRDIPVKKSALEQFPWRIAVGPSNDSFGGAFDSQGVANPVLATLPRRFALLNDKQGDPSGNYPKVQLAKIPDDAVLANKINQLQSKWDGIKSTSPLKLPAIHLFNGGNKVDLRDSIWFLKKFSDEWPTPIGKAIELPLGEPIAVAETVRLSLVREPRRNLLLLAPRIEDVAGTIVIMLLSALTQRRHGELEIEIFGPFGSQPEEVALRQQLVDIAGQFHGDVVAHNSGMSDSLLEQQLANLASEVSSAASAGGKPRKERLLVILGSHRLKPFREVCLPLIEILKKGPDVGTHVLCWSNSIDGIKPAAPRDLAEFGFGAVGQDDEQVPNGKIVQGTRDPNRLTVFGGTSLTDDHGKRVRAFAAMDQRNLQYVIGKIIEKTKRSASHG